MIFIGMRKRIIKITNRQLKEATGVEAFNDVSATEVPGYSGTKEISVGGYLDDNELAEPITTDDYADTMAPQSCYYRSLGYGSGRVRRS